MKERTSHELRIYIYVILASAGINSDEQPGNTEIDLAIHSGGARQ